MSNDPCLKCPLPDCDEESPKCALKRAKAEYRRQAEKIGAVNVSPELRAGNSLAYRVWKLEDLARKSEGAA